MIMMTKRLLLISSVFLLCDCYKILVLFPHIGRSHFLVFEPMLKKLAAIGHEVTVVSFFPQNQPPANYTDISLVSENEVKGGEVMKMDEIAGSKWEMYQGAHLIAWFADISCPLLLSSANLRQFLEQENSFDLVITEMFNTNCAMGVVKKFQAPVIALSTCINPPWLNDFFGASSHPAYIPAVFMDHSDQMTFYERVESTVLWVFYRWVFEYYMRRPGNEYSKKYLGIDVLEDGDMFYNSSLLLSNTHYSFNRPKPLPPNVIEVAGIHIRESKQLPENFEKFLNESAHGVIYMSMGTMIRGTSFPKDKRENFVKAFSRLPQRVIWKWEEETMEGKPDNVMLSKWAPQRDILDHPKVLAFISHGGLLGTLEAVHSGVPIIVIPHFGDQHANARAIEASGGGVILKMADATEEHLTYLLNQVLSNEMREKARALSRRFNDRPLSPMDTAIYWIEYVAKHGGARFMRTAAVDMPFYQYYLLDVIAFISATILFLCYISYQIFRLTRQQFKAVKPIEKRG